MAKRKRGEYRSDAEIQLGRVTIAQMKRRGYTNHEIAEKLGVHPNTVSHDWKIILKEAHEERSQQTDLFIEESCQQIDEIIRAAWRAAEMAEREYVKETEEDYTNGQTSSHKSVRVVEHRLPPAAYYQVILDCIKEKNALKGLYPKKELEITGHQSLTWEIFSGSIGKEPADVIQQRMIDALEFKPAPPEVLQLKAKEVIDSVAARNEPKPVKGDNS